MNYLYNFEVSCRTNNKKEPKKKKITKTNTQGYPHNRAWHVEYSPNEYLTHLVTMRKLVQDNLMFQCADPTLRFTMSKPLCEPFGYTILFLKTVDLKNFKLVMSGKNSYESILFKTNPFQKKKNKNKKHVRQTYIGSTRKHFEFCRYS